MRKKQKKIKVKLVMRKKQKKIKVKLVQNNNEMMLDELVKAMRMFIKDKSLNNFEITDFTFKRLYDFFQNQFKENINIKHAWNKILRESSNNWIYSDISIMYVFFGLLITLSFISIFFGIFLNYFNPLLSLPIIALAPFFTMMYAFVHDVVIETKDSELLNNFLSELLIQEQKRKEKTKDNSKQNVQEEKLEDLIMTTLNDISHHLELSTEDPNIIKHKYFLLKNTSNEISRLLKSDHTNLYQILKLITSLEKDIYAEEADLKIKNETLPQFNSNKLYSRLTFLGFKREEIIQNKYLQEVCKLIDKIREKPYTGCESDIASLYQIAQDYVYSKIKEPTQDEVLHISSHESTLLKQLVDIEIRVGEKQNRASINTSLDNDLNNLSDILKEEKGSYNDDSTEFIKSYYIKPLK